MGKGKISLDHFFKKYEDQRAKEKSSESRQKVSSQYELIKILENSALDELNRIAHKNYERENSRRAFLLGIDYDPDYNKAILKFYDLENHAVFILRDKSNHRPYFLTDLDPDSIKRIVAKYGLLSSIHEIVEVEKYDALKDKPVTMRKIIVKTPQDVGGGGGRKGLRVLLGEEHSWEAHIKYYLCYLYDNPFLWPSTIYSVKGGDLHLIRDSHDLNELSAKLEPRFRELIDLYVPIITQEIPRPKFYALDIEAGSTPDKMPDFRNPREPIISVSLVWYDPDIDDFDGVVYLLRWRGATGGLGNISIKSDVSNPKVEGKVEFNGRKVKVLLYESEKHLLIDLFKILWEVPILVTFNGDNFDLNYLYARAQFLGIDKKLIPFSVKRTAELITAELKNGIHIDLYKFYSNGAIKTYVFKDSYETVSLEELSSVLLNKHKLFVHVNFEKLSLEEIAKYNWWDAFLTAELMVFKNWLPWRIIVILSRITKYPLRDLTRRGVSSWIGNWFYAEMRRRNWLIPNERDFKLKQQLTDLAPRPQPVIKGKRYRGAIVFQPKAGIWFNVYVLDFASIYPTIIKVHNISFETVLCPHEECRDNKVADLDYWVCKKREGLASQLVGFIRDLRVKHYKKMSKLEQDPQKREFYGAIQSALKVLINASYGVFGTELFSLYFLPVAESITAIGRQKVLSVANKAKELNLDVIYGDTDSIFLHNPPKEKIEYLINWAANELKVDLEVDKIYIFVAFSERKKNYFGLLIDGSLDIKGLLGKKRNTPEFLKKEFNEVLGILKKVRSPEDMQRAKKEIEEKIINIYRKLSKGVYELEELAFRVMLSKPIEKYTKTTPEHVKAAKRLNRPVHPGEVIAYVKCRDGPWPVEVLKEDKNWRRKIDLEKYYEYTRSVFDQLLDALGIKIEELEKKARGISDISQFFL